MKRYKKEEPYHRYEEEGEGAVGGGSHATDNNSASDRRDTPSPSQWKRRKIEDDRSSAAESATPSLSIPFPHPSLPSVSLPSGSIVAGEGGSISHDIIPPPTAAASSSPLLPLADSIALTKSLGMWSRSLAIIAAPKADSSIGRQAGRRRRIAHARQSEDDIATNEDEQQQHQPHPTFYGYLPQQPYQLQSALGFESDIELSDEEDEDHQTNPINMPPPNTKTPAQKARMKQGQEYRTKQKRRHRGNASHPARLRMRVRVNRTQATSIHLVPYLLLLCVSLFRLCEW